MDVVIRLIGHGYFDRSYQFDAPKGPKRFYRNIAFYKMPSAHAVTSPATLHPYSALKQMRRRAMPHLLVPPHKLCLDMSTQKKPKQMK